MKAHAVLDVHMFGAAEEVQVTDAEAGLLVGFPAQRRFHGLTRFDVPAGQEIPGLSAPVSQQHPVLSKDDETGADLDRCGGQRHRHSKTRRDRPDRHRSDTGMIL